MIENHCAGFSGIKSTLDFLTIQVDNDGFLTRLKKVRIGKFGHKLTFRNHFHVVIEIARSLGKSFDDGLVFVTILSIRTKHGPVNGKSRYVFFDKKGPQQVLQRFTPSKDKKFVNVKKCNPILCFGMGRDTVILCVQLFYASGEMHNFDIRILCKIVRSLHVLVILHKNFLKAECQMIRQPFLNVAVLLFYNAAECNFHTPKAGLASLFFSVGSPMLPQSCGIRMEASQIRVQRVLFNCIKQWIHFLFQDIKGSVGFKTRIAKRAP
jgi:hypothetical protein